MAWEGSNRRERLPRDWPRLRIRVLARAAYRCEARDPDSGVRCAERATDVDHIIPGDNHDESNLQALCRWHHARKSSREGHAAQRPRPTRRRPPEPHPGLID